MILRFRLRYNSDKSEVSLLYNAICKATYLCEYIQLPGVDIGGIKTLLWHIDVYIHQGPTAQGKQGKWSQKNPYQGKHREFGNSAKTQGKHREFGLLKL